MKLPAPLNNENRSYDIALIVLIVLEVVLMLDVEASRMIINNNNLQNIKLLIVVFLFEMSIISLLAYTARKRLRNIGTMALICSIIARSLYGFFIDSTGGDSNIDYNVLRLCDFFTCIYVLLNLSLDGTRTNNL